jgi:DNA gyrase/topoisomerase IV subunit B
MNRSEEAIHKVLYVDRTIDDVRVEVAFQYTTGEEERSRCYANNAHNPGGGTHLSGFRAALTRALNTYGQKENHFKNVTTTSEDFREGITVVVSIQVPEPQFESQTKIKLNNPEVEGIVSSVLYEYLAKFLEENPKEAGKIMKKVVLAAEAREAAQKAKKALKDRKSILNSGGLPGKLMDCTTRDRDESELFLVEGQCGQRPQPPLPGDPAPARQGAQRRESPHRKSARQRRAGLAHLRYRHRHRQHRGAGTAAVRQDHPPRGGSSWPGRPCSRSIKRSMSAMCRPSPR